MTNTDLKALLDKAEEYNDAGNYDEAERLAKKVLATLQSPAEDGEPVIKGSKTEKAPLQSKILRSDSEALKGEMPSQADDRDFRVRAFGILGSAANLRGNYPAALEHFAAMKSAAEAAGEKSATAFALKGFGLVFMNLGDYEKALEYNRQALVAYEELGEISGIARVTMNLGNVYWYLGLFDKALECCEKALAAHEELEDKKMMGAVMLNTGNVYTELGLYDKALEHYANAFAIFDETGAKSWQANVRVCIGNVYTSLGFYDKALENFGNALAVLEEIGAKLDIANVTGSIGSAYQSQGSYDSALEYFLRALAVYEELDAKYGVASATGNIGNVYWFLGDYDNALKYYEKNLAAASEIRAKLGVAVGIGNIGCVYTVKDYEGYDAVKGEEYLLKALALSGEINAKEKIAYWHEYLACLYENEKRWEDFAFHYKKYHETEKEVQSESAKKQANLMEQQRQTAEREKALAAERAEARATQNVLHQVLPPSIADRLVKGEKVADYFQNVSILFADIVGFTPIASRMPAKVVLAFLNHVFGAFDDIIEKHGCEKIKTIGDGYLAVAGAPIPCADHAERIARAALDMMEDIHLPEDIRRHLPNGLQFSIRIGIHTGPAFGGIIGAKRFVYDIYSDAVNIAARMESHGEPGKIHCSDDFAHHLQNRDEAFVFKEREEMDIKGKGKMRTYFLEKNI